MQALSTLIEFARTVHRKAMEKGISRRHVFVGLLLLLVVVNGAHSYITSPPKPETGTSYEVAAPIPSTPPIPPTPKKPTAEKDRLTDYYTGDECNVVIEQAFEMQPGELVFNRKEQVEAQEWWVWRRVWQGTLKGYTDYMCGVHKGDLVMIRGIYEKHSRAVYEKWYNLNREDFGKPSEELIDLCTRNGCY